MVNSDEVHAVAFEGALLGQVSADRGSHFLNPETIALIGRKRTAQKDLSIGAA